MALWPLYVWQLHDHRYLAWNNATTNREQYIKIMPSSRAQRLLLRLQRLQHLRHDGVWGSGADG